VKRLVMERLIKLLIVLLAVLICTASFRLSYEFTKAYESATPERVIVGTISILLIILTLLEFTGRLIHVFAYDMGHTEIPLSTDFMEGIAFLVKIIYSKLCQQMLV
jgi:hypothetical protein